MISKKARAEIYERSNGQCEAMVKTGKVWSRCWAMPIEIHHMLTRARGGNILDRIGETHHLIALCSRCHRASDGELAYAGDLLIDGYVVWNNDKQRPVYVGTDTYLSKAYPKETSYAGSH